MKKICNIPFKQLKTTFGSQETVRLENIFTYCYTFLCVPKKKKKKKKTGSRTCDNQQRIKREIYDDARLIMHTHT